MHCMFSFEVDFELENRTAGSPVRATLTDVQQLAESRLATGKTEACCWHLPIQSLR